MTNIRRIARTGAGNARLILVAVAAYQNLDRVLAQFQEFCVVTESVRDGIEVIARVEDANGLRLRAREAG